MELFVINTKTMIVSCMKCLKLVIVSIYNLKKAQLLTHHSEKNSEAAE